MNLTGGQDGYQVYEPWFINICESEFWDWNMTWYPKPGDIPDFPPCFHKTVLIYIPCFLLWIFAPFEIMRANSNQAGPIPWGIGSITKLVHIMILFFATTFELPLSIWSDLSAEFQNDFWADLIRCIIKCLTFVLAGYLVLLFRRKGVRKSLPVWGFWLCMLVLQAFTVSSVIRTSIFIGARFLNILSFISILVVFIACCICDAKPSYVDPAGKKL